MSTPPYHLRTNKAVERALFVELLRKVINFQGGTYDEWEYLGFGGPHMEDFNFLARAFDFSKLTSLEKDQWVHSRQKINCSASNINPTNSNTEDFLEELSRKPREQKGMVLWLDYTGGAEDWLKHIDEFTEYIITLPKPTIAKITLVASRPQEHRNSSPSNIVTWLNSTFGDYGPYIESETSKLTLYKSAYQILKKRLASNLGYEDAFSIHPLAAYFYCDTSPILTVTLLSSESGNSDSILQGLKSNAWPYLNTNWEEPHVINVPDFTIRERLAVERCLPHSSVESIQETLQVSFDENPEESTNALKQYILFKQHIPFFHQIVY